MEFSAAEPWDIWGRRHFSISHQMTTIWAIHTNCHPIFESHLRSTVSSLSIFLKFKLTGYLNSSLFVNRQLGCLVYFLVRYAFFLVLDHSSFTVEKRASFHHYSCLKQRFLSTLCASISIGMKHTFRWPIYNHLTKQPKSHCWSKKRNVRRPFLRCSAAQRQHLSWWALKKHFENASLCNYLPNSNRPIYPFFATYSKILIRRKMEYHVWNGPETP